MQNREVCYAQKELVNPVIVIVQKMSFTCFHGALFMKRKVQTCTIKYTINNNFISLSDNDKARWLLLQEDRDILFALGTYIHSCFEKRNK